MPTIRAMSKWIDRRKGDLANETLRDVEVESFFSNKDSDLNATLSGIRTPGYGERPKLDALALKVKSKFPSIINKAPVLSSRRAVYVFASDVSALFGSVQEPESKAAFVPGYYTPGTVGAYIVKASFTNPRLRVPWLRTKVREAQTHRLVFDALRKTFGDSCALAAPFAFAGYNPDDGLYYHVSYVPEPESVRQLIPLSNLFQTNRVSPEVYRSIEATIVSMWSVGAVQGDTSSGTLLYSPRSGRTYVVDFDTVVSLAPDLKNEIATIWTQLPATEGTLQMDACFKIVKTEVDEPFGVKVWSATGEGYEREIRAAAVKLYERTTWLPDYNLLSILWEKRQEKPGAIPMSKGYVDVRKLLTNPIQAVQATRQFAGRVKSRVKRVMPDVEFTRPVFRRLKTAGNSSNSNGDWEPRSHGKSWAVIFFKALSGDYSGYKPPKTPKGGNSIWGGSPSFSASSASAGMFDPSSSMNEGDMFLDAEEGGSGDLPSGNGSAGSGWTGAPGVSGSSVGNALSGNGRNGNNGGDGEAETLDTELLDNGDFVKKFVEIAKAKLPNTALRAALKSELVGTTNYIGTLLNKKRIAWIAGELVDVVRDPSSSGNVTQRSVMALKKYADTPFNSKKIKESIDLGESKMYENILAMVAELTPGDEIDSNVFEKIKTLLAKTNSNAQLQTFAARIHYEIWPVSNSSITAPLVYTLAKELNTKDYTRIHAIVVLSELAHVLAMEGNVLKGDTLTWPKVIEMYERSITTPEAGRALNPLAYMKDYRWSFIVNRAKTTYADTRETTKDLVTAMIKYLGAYNHNLELEKNGEGTRNDTIA